MKLTVLVPTYRRVEDLQRCLQGITTQTRMPHEILLVTREEDQATLLFASQWSHTAPITLIKVELPGQVNALNAGLAAVSGDVVAITDDDAVPRPDWLERIEWHFTQNSTVGGVGGRDWVHRGQEVDERNASLVGSIQWFGRLIGNHHLGSGPPREVDILKGANMSYRMEALKGLSFDQQLRGRGAQVSNDLAFSLLVKRNGWNLVYDPKVAVDHFPAARFDLDQRGGVHPQTIEDAAFNQFWAILKSLEPGLQQRVACAWQTIVGSKAQPGLLHLPLGIAQGDKHVMQRWRAASRGRAAARLLSHKQD